ncbi:MAG: hypothetical protein KBC02_03125, partial [Candidatus Pacebacteria bacterium]|nr:hypothetical protein [Candidatus Paceibacterota bacterium]
MDSPHQKLGRLLRTKPEVLEAMERKMNRISGQQGVLFDIQRQIEITIERTLAGLGLSSSDSAEDVKRVLAERTTHLDGHHYRMLGKPDLSNPTVACQQLCSVISKVFTPPKGLFIKHEVA